MGDVVNLRQARKQRARDDKAATADQNRRLHGRTRAERETTEAERDKANRALDGHRRSDEP